MPGLPKALTESLLFSVNLEVGIKSPWGVGGRFWVGPREEMGDEEGGERGNEGTLLPLPQLLGCRV